MKTCSKCGVEKPLDEFNRMSSSRDGLRPDCRDCRRAWAQANHEAELARLRKYREANREAMRRRDRERYARNRNAELERHRKYREANRDAINARKRDARRAGAQAVENARRKARKLAAFVEDVSTAMVIERDWRAGHVECGCCGLPVAEDAHLEHVMPLAKGGAHVLENLTLAHPECNLSKGARLPDDFLPEWEYAYDPHRPVWTFVDPLDRETFTAEAVEVVGGLPL